MKTAVIVAGVCRFSDIAHKSWNILPDADWYLSTWDISQKPYSREATTSTNEILNIKHLFCKIIISNYKEEYLETNFDAYDRPFILLEKIYAEIKDLNYERIIYFRPDLMLYSLEELSSIDFDVDNSTLKILDSHEPDFWIIHEKKLMQDSFLVFTIKTFELLLKNRKILCSKSIHRSLYDFVADNKINVIPLSKMRSAIIRDNVYDTDDLSWKNLTLLFSQTYITKDHIGKFPKIIDLKIEQKPDYEKIKFSQTNGGILKLRNK